MSLFFSQKNGVVSPSPLSIVFFRHFSWIPHFPLMRPLIRIADYIGSKMLSNRIIDIHNHYFPPITMALLHRHHFWLPFWSFLWFLLMDDWNHSLGSLITLEINFLIDKIIAIHHDCFCPSTMLSFHCHHYWLLYFEVFCDYSSRMTVTTRLDHWLHWNYFSERSYYCHISGK